MSRPRIADIIRDRVAASTISIIRLRQSAGSMAPREPIIFFWILHLSPPKVLSRTPTWGGGYRGKPWLEPCEQSISILASAAGH